MHTDRNLLVDGIDSGQFLEALRTCSMANRGDRQQLATLIADLHNEGAFDAVLAFADLKSKSPNDGEFFVIRSIFEKALGKIVAPAKNVMECVGRLVVDAGQDYAAGTILDGYVQYLRADLSRAPDALQLIERDPSQFAHLLPATLLSSLTGDPLQFASEAVRMASSPEFELRRQAVFTLGSLKWPAGHSIPESAIDAVRNAVAHAPDDQMLAAALRTLFIFRLHDVSAKVQLGIVISSVLAQAGDSTLHALASIFASRTNELDDWDRDLMVANLVKVRPSNKGTLDLIDLGLASLIEGPEFERGLEILEAFLSDESAGLTVETFGSCARALLRRQEVLAKIVTRWFLRGERPLCEAIQTISKGHHLSNLKFEVDMLELGEADSSGRLSLCQRAVGYLFHQPVSAASILLRLLRTTGDETLRRSLCELLFDPILINYAGDVCDYLKAQQKLEVGVTSSELASVLKRADEYLGAVQSVGILSALHPSDAQRDAQSRYVSGQMERAFETARERSPLLGLFPRSVLLYGRKSIDYVESDGHEPMRIETPLHQHGASVEIPRMEAIDLFGLNYQLYRLKLGKGRA